MTDSTYRNDVCRDWYQLPTDIWTSIFSYSDYTTSTHVAIAFAFSVKYRKILHLLEPLNITDLLNFTGHSTESVRNQIRVLATSVRLRAATLSSAFPVPAEGLLSIPKFIQLSEASLEKLSCYLADFSVLERFHHLRELQLLCPERKEIEEGVNFCWDLRPEQAASLARLHLLTKLSFVGFTTVNLSTVDIPHLKELTINFQATRGILETQNRCVFSLPNGCLLDKLTIIGPEDQESDPDEEGEFSMTTNVGLQEVLNNCKSIYISGASVTLDIDSYPHLDHLSAAAACIVTAKTWSKLSIELVKYVEDLENVGPDLCVYHGDQGTEEISIRRELVDAIVAEARVQGQPAITCKVMEEFMPLGFDSAMDISDDDDEYEHDSRFDNDSGVMTITLVVHRK